MSIHDLLSNRTGKIEGVEILNTHGNSLNIPITENDLKEFKNTFDEYKEKYRPNIKIDHSLHQKILKNIIGIDNEDSEIPNIGFIDNLRVAGKSLLADFVEIPEKLVDLLFNGQFKGVSPEFYNNYRGTGKKFIEAVALTNYPRLKHQYNLSDKDEVFGFTGSINIIDEVTKMSDVTKSDLEKVEKSLMTKLSEFFTGSDDKARSMENEIKELRAQLSEKNEMLTKFSESLTALSGQARQSQVEALCTKSIAAGVPQATVNHFKPLLMSDISEGKINFSDGEKSMSDVIQEFFDTQKGIVDFSDRTSTNVDKPGNPELDGAPDGITDEDKAYFSELRKQGYSDFEAWGKVLERE